MDNTEIINLTQEAIMLMIKLSTPVMLIGLLVGVIIALLQALTQIQEITLVFVPKIVAIYLGLVFFLPGMAMTLINFTQYLADKIVGIG